MKHTFKKLLAFGLAATLSLSLFAGCGGGDKKDDGGKVELTMSVWSPEQEALMKAQSAKYMETHPNITITTQMSPWSEYWTKLEASATGSAAPDIITMNVLHVEEYAEAGILMDLTEAEAASDLKAAENFPAPLLNGYIVEGKLYGIPKDFDTNGIFFNKELFDAAGVAYPENGMTFEDFRALCEELKDKLPEGCYPTAVNRNSGQTTYNATIYANGGYVLNEDNTKSGWDDPKTVGGVQPWLDLVLDGLSPTLEQMTDTDPDSMFMGGHLAMYLSGNYMISDYNKTLEGKFGIVQRPSFNGKHTDIINGLAYSVSANTPHAEEAKEFVLWLGSKEAQTIEGNSKTVIPARIDCQELYLNCFPELDLQIFLDSAKEAELLPHCKVSSELGNVSKEFFEQAWRGEITLTEAGKLAAEAQNAVLDKMNSK